MLQINLFGAPEIKKNGWPIQITRRKSRALVYFLAAQPAPVPREQLLSFFWMDLDRSQAQQVLRTNLHTLRKELEADITTNPAVGFSSTTIVDTRLFEGLLSAPTPSLDSLTRALELYTGDFLTGFDLPDTPAFGDWASLERERFRRMAVRGLTALSHLQAERRDYSSALAALERALSFNPLQEDVQRDAIRLHYLAGDRPGAIRRYDELRRLLDEQLGVPPMAETRKLYDAIISDAELDISPARLAPTPPSPAPPSPPPPSQLPIQTVSSPLPFTGRALELASLSSLFAARKLYLIEGEPGIGKTRLAEEFLAGFTTQPAAVILVGRARELEQSQPYQPIIEALRGLLHHPAWAAIKQDFCQVLPPIWQSEVGRLLPELAGSQDLRPPASADEPRLWEAVNQFLNTLAAYQPVVLFLDDLHWADSSSLTLLGYLVRQNNPVQLSFLATSWPATARQAAPRTALSTLQQTLIREGRLERLPLARLTAGEVASIAQRLSPSGATELANWLYATSEGNPYILADLVRHARQQNWLAADGSFSSPDSSSEPVVPQTVYSLIQSRLAALSDVARHVLDLAVAAGREFEYPLIAQASALSEMATLDAIDELRQSGLVHPTDSTHFTFDHSLTMEVAYREVGEPRHRLLHRRIAEALERLHHEHLDSVAGLLARHFEEGEAPDRAAPYAMRAARQAAALAAWKEAIAWNQLALQAAPTQQRWEIWQALGRAYLLDGQLAQSAEAFRSALDSVPAQQRPTEASQLRLDLARSLLHQARYSEAVSLAQQVLAASHPLLAARAELLWGTALSLEGADLVLAADHLRLAESLLLAEPNPDPLHLAQVRFELGSVAAQQGDLQLAVLLYRESLDCTLRSESEEADVQRILCHNNLGYHLLLLGDPSARQDAEAGRRLAEEKGQITLLAYLFSTLGEILLAEGSLDQAEQSFQEGLAIAVRLDLPERIAGLTANLGLLALARARQQQTLHPDPAQQALAIHRLSTALALSDSLRTHHLSAQIRLWLAPLLPPAERRLRLAEARALVESAGRRRLLAELNQLEAELL